MTYPPQPGPSGHPGWPGHPGQYGGPGPQGAPQPQPGGYGQQHPGFPPQGVHNSQPQQFPYGPAGQQFPGAQPYPQVGGFGGGTPPRPGGKKALWTVLGTSAGLLLAAVLFTGFVAPGFFLADGPDDLADQIITALETKDFELARSITCEGSRETDPELPGDVTAELTGDIREVGERAFVPMRISFGGTSLTGEFGLARTEGNWCVDSFQPDAPQGAGQGGPPPITPVPGGGGAVAGAERG